MAPVAPGRPRGAAVAELALPALTVAAGLQLLRLMVPTVLSVARERLGVALAGLALFAIGVFLLDFLGPLVPGCSARAGHWP